jgi:hypothetical protein
MKRSRKSILIMGGALLIYGYLCRWLDIYFFWDSKSIGWALLIVGGIGFLVSNIETRENQNRKTTWNKIGIGLLSFILGVGTIFSASIRLFSDAYGVATNYIQNDRSLKAQLGNVNGFSMVTTGSIQTQTNFKGKSGFAVFELTAMGDKKFKDLRIQLIKNPESPNWEVERVE